MTRPTRRLRVETLEDRAVPATHTWIDGPNSNNWSDATNWVGGSVPTSGEVGGTIVVLGVADTPNQDIAGLVIDRLEFSPNTGGVLLTLGQPLTINGGVTPSVRSVSGNNLIEGSTLTLAVSTITVSVETAPLSGDQLVIDSAVVGSQPVQKTGPGRLLLRSPASSFTGNLTVAAGRLIPFNAPGGLDPVVGPLGNPQVAGRTITVAAGASLDFFTGDVFGNPSSTPLVTLSVAGSLGIGTVSTNALGPVVLNGGTIVADNGLAIDNRTWNLRGGSVTVIGSQPSTLTLGAVPANDRLGFHLAATTLFDVADATGTAATDLIVNAVLADQSSSQGGAAGGATFQGAGTVALNAANTYTGPTLVAGAELLVNGSTISATTVAADGVLGGRGTITGSVTANPFGGVAPGDAGTPGTLSTGNLQLQAQSKFAARVHGAGVGQFDALNVTGTVDVTSASLIIPGTGPALSTSQSVVIISNDGADPVTGTFAGLPQGGTVTAADGRTFTVSYTAGDGNDVALIGTTPTPPTAVLMTPPPMVDMLNNSATTTFTVRYTDDAAVDGSTLGADIDVIAPDGTTVVGTATANPAANGTPLAAVYTLTRTRPWLPTERGKFTLKLRANEVRDTAGTAAAATTLGTFEVCVRDRLPAEFLASGATAPAATQTAFLVLRSSVSRRLTDVRGESLSPANRSFTPDADGKYGAGSVVDFGNQAHVAVGDVNGDGTPDRVLGSAFGSSSVRIISGTDNTLLADFQALGLINGDHLFGVYVAVGDLDGDGKADVAVTGDALDALNGPQANGLQVRVFSGASMTNGTTSPTVLADFNGLASLDGQQGEGPNVRLGGRVAIGDVNGDGRPDLLVAAGNGGGPRITIWDGAAFPGAAANGRKPTKNPIANLFVFEQGQRGGAFVAAGDVNGDCFLDIIAGGGPGGGPRVRIVNGKMLFDPILKLFQANVNLDDPANLTNGLVLSNFFAFNVNDRGGVRVAAKDSDGDTRADVIVGAGYPSTANGERTLFQSTFFLDPILRPSVPRTVKVYLGSALAQTTGEPNFQEFNPFGDASVVDGVFVG